MGIYKSSELDKRKGKIERGQKKERKLVKEEIAGKLTIHVAQSEILALRKST